MCTPSSIRAFCRQPPQSCHHPLPVKAQSLRSVPANQQLVVEHGDIPGFMEAMTMGYKVDPSSLLAPLKAGDTYPLYHRHAQTGH